MKARLVASLAAGALAVGGFIAISPPASANTGCTLTQGYYKNHAGSFLTGEFAVVAETQTVIDAKFSASFGGLTGTALDYAILMASVSGGSTLSGAELIAAKQLLATAANGFGTEPPMDPSVKVAYNALLDEFRGKITLTRAEVIAYAAVLDAYNNGLLGVPHCA